MSAYIQNAFYVPEQDRYYVSRHTHDFVTITLADGASIHVDGGPSYLKRGGDLHLIGSRFVDISLAADAPFAAIWRRLCWGSRGKAGDQPLSFRPLAMLETDHLEAILRTQPQVAGTVVEQVIRHVLETRRAGP